ncbi:HD domain-containing protein [Sphingobium sp.]|uniref:HD domain-containing protein n=1 Tax=Sphingobium sp. TaxID=1912891 RepID=UPI000DB1D0E2|nr:HD domain-containing protein [Sphingobium sp.]PZU68648.1 MAG: HAD family hydrolase [Sphingobium sp.]
MPDTIPAIISFYAVAERLKIEMRHSWLSNGRQESVAEHSWMMALLCILLHDKLDRPVDSFKVLKMTIVHDLVEAIAGDIPYFEESDRKRNKAAAETAAMSQIRSMLPAEVGAHIEALWLEFEERGTDEAKFAAALDNLDVQMQHNLASLSTWLPREHDLVYEKVVQPCAYDTYLKSFAEGVVVAAEGKMAEGGIDVAALRDKHGFSGAGPHAIVSM